MDRPWQIDGVTSVRVGRMPTPAFLSSEVRQVRYAQPCVRPPLEVYGQLPIFSEDGLEIIPRTQLGDWQAEWQAGASALSFDTPQTNSTDTYPVHSLYFNQGPAYDYADPGSNWLYTLSLDFVF